MMVSGAWTIAASPLQPHSGHRDSLQHAACAERTPRAKSGIGLLPNRQDYRPQRRPRLRRVLLCRLRRNQISPPGCFRCRVMPAVRYSNWASTSRSGTATASDWMLSATAERAATPILAYLSGQRQRVQRGVILEWQGFIFPIQRMQVVMDAGVGMLGSAVVFPSSFKISVDGH